MNCSWIVHEYKMAQFMKLKCTLICPFIFCSGFMIHSYRYIMLLGTKSLKNTMHLGQNSRCHRTEGTNSVVEGYCPSQWVVWGGLCVRVCVCVCVHHPGWVPFVAIIPFSGLKPYVCYHFSLRKRILAFIAECPVHENVDLDVCQQAHNKTKQIRYTGIMTTGLPDVRMDYSLVEARRALGRRTQD